MAGKRKFFPVKEELDRLYQTHTMKSIALFYGVGETVIWKRIKEFGIVYVGLDNPRKRPKKFTESHIEALRQEGRRRRGKWAGDKNPNWRGGRMQENLQARSSGAYMEWKAASLKRAAYCCQECGAAKGQICPHCGHKVSLHVHHIYSFSKYPEKRFDPENSEVLCAKCHYSRHFGKSGEFGETPERTIPSEAVEG